MTPPARSCTVLRLAAACATAICLAAAAGPAHAARTLARNLEPVVVYGAQTASFAGTDVTHLVVFRYAEATNAWTQIPFQVDERAPAGGGYFIADDGLWDTNDELALLAQDCGDAAPPTAWPAGTDKPTRYEIAVTDPLSGGVAWAYLFTAPMVTPVSTQYMSYSGTATNTITGTAYSIDFLDGKPHIETELRVLAAGGGDGVDLVDRSKTRVRVLFSTYDEEDVNSTIAGVRLGPVRLIERVTSKLIGFDASDVTAWYYPAFIRTATTIISSFFDISWLRYTYDFNETVAGMRHFDDSGAGGGNGGASGIAIDGQTDAVSLTPLGQWWEVDSSHGCYIVVGDYSQAPVQSMRFWYQDGGSDPDGSTGSDGLWGECGAYFTNADNTTFLVDTWSFMLAANRGNVGAQYESYYENPLAIAPVAQTFVTAVGDPVAGGDHAAPRVGPATPNPFARATAIPVELDLASPDGNGPAAAMIYLMDVGGRVVRRLPVGAGSSGRASVTWDGRDDTGRPVPGGVYTYALAARGAAANAGPTVRGRVLLIR